jgi:hypothetical protein
MRTTTGSTSMMVCQEKRCWPRGIRRGMLTQAMYNARKVETDLSDLG